MGLPLKGMSCRFYTIAKVFRRTFLLLYMSSSKKAPKGRGKVARTVGSRAKARAKVQRKLGDPGSPFKDGLNRYKRRPPSDG